MSRRLGMGGGAVVPVRAGTGGAGGSGAALGSKVSLANGLVVGVTAGVEPSPQGLSAPLLVCRCVGGAFAGSSDRL